MANTDVDENEITEEQKEYIYNPNRDFSELAKDFNLEEEKKCKY